MNYTKIIKTQLDEQEIDFDAFKRQFESRKKRMRWETVVPNLAMPMMQGMAINAILGDFPMKPEKLSWNGSLSFPEYYPSIIGIETKSQRMYFLDNGIGIILIGMEDK